jgi:hypothetical protein
MEGERILMACIFIVILGGGMLFMGNKFFKYVEGAVDGKLNASDIGKKMIISFNKGDVEMSFVSQTEYTFSDTKGSTIIKLVGNNGEKINTTCYEEILYPDKSIYIAWSPMTQHWVYGNYYMDFSLPTIAGIYDQEVRCLVNNKNISIGKGFHMSNITNMIGTIVEDKIQNSQQDVMSMVT